MAGNTRIWAVAIAAAALVGGPLAANAQIPPSAAPATAAEAHETEKGQRRLADEHLQKAAATLEGIAVDQQPVEAQSRLAELQQRIRTLQQAAPAAAEPPVEERETAAAPPLDRKAELAAIDRMFDALLGDGKEKPERAPSPDTVVGTSGATQPQLDTETRSKLETARTHITAYAAAIQSVESAQHAQPSHVTASAPGPPGSPVPDAGDATAVTSPVDPTPTPTGTSPTDVPQTPAAPDRGEWQAPAPAPSQAESEEARRHLLAARNALSELTQMPQATAITGETRAQISQLISRFNALIAANAGWRESLDGVKTTLDALLKPPAEDAPVTDPQPDEPVGTTGMEMLAPEIRAKLAEFRSHLHAFEQAAGRDDTVPANRAEPQDPPATTTAAPGEVATRVSETDPTTASGSTSTGSPAAQMPAPPAETVGGEPMEAGAPIASEALRHIEAIEAILLRHARESGDGVTGTTGATADPATPDTRTPAPGPGAIEEIRTHLNELRRLVESRGR